MGIDYKELYERMLQYWNEHDGVEFDIKSLKESFSAEDIACILFEDTYREMDYAVVNKFRNKIWEKDGLFSPDEADRLYESYPGYSYEFMVYCSDEYLLSLIDGARFGIIRYVIYNLDSDENLMEVFKKVKDPDLKASALSRIKDDNLKMKYLWKIPSYEKTKVIMSLQDDYLIEKYLTIFRGSKGDLISKLQDDKKKIKYFKRYFAILSKDEKSQIIRSFKDDQLVLEYLKYVGDYVKGEVISYRFDDNFEIVDQLIGTINNKSVLADILKKSHLGTRYADKFIDRITNQDDLQEIIFNLEDTSLILKYFPRLTYKRKLERIKEEYEPVLKFKLLKYITKIKDVIEIIEHTEEFPDYAEEYDYLCDVYANQYNVDRGRVKALIKNVSLAVLKYLENENIIKILKSNEDEFVLLMRIFDKIDLKMNQSSMNDILNAMLQRQFRMSAPEIILIFPLTLNAIDSKDRETVVKNIEHLNVVVNLEEEIKEYGWNKELFIEALMNKDESAIDFLHVLTAKYIRSERSNFVQEHIEKAQESCTEVYCDKNDLMRYIINTFPIEFLISYFNVSVEEVEHGTITREEYDFSKNKELIKQIILYKKNPKDYERIPDEVRANLKVFNVLFERKFSKVHVNRFFNYDGKKNVEFKEVDDEFLASILMYVDIDKLRVNFFNNPELVEKFMKFWKQYKIGGWGNTFNSVLSSAGVVLDPEVVANFIQYFGLSYEQLKEKKEKREISSISVTALLDLAACYSTSSKKYSLLFGDEDFKFIASNPGPNSSTWSKDKRIDRAVDLVRTIRTRDYVTVPPVDKDFELKSGKSMNVVVGNFSNMMNLTYGERTGACMRIGGAGKSLFDFCLEDESGFHIRFSNPKTGKFVSRVSGFRNGNTIFLNELRYSEDSTFTNKDVVEACRSVARELIERSKESQFPIDNVVITPYYAMKDSGLMAKNLGIKDPQKGMKKFYTDVSESSVILATSAPNDELVIPKLGVVGPKYDVLRDKKRVLYNRDAYSYLAHLQVLDQVIGGRKVEDVDVEINEEICVCLAGEDWCVTIDKQGNISKYMMKHSNNRELAIDEMQEALNYLKENLSKEMNIANNVLGM